MSNGNKVLNLVDPLDVNTAKAGPPSCPSNPLVQRSFSVKDIPRVCCCPGFLHAMLYIICAREGPGRTVLLMGI